MDITGQTHHRWTVLAKTAARNSSGCVMYECRCECGTVRNVSGKMLRSGESKSCGCYNRQRTIETHTLHGMCRTPLHDAWTTMMQRCYNPRNKRFPRYGGRGIAVCGRWHDAATFIDDNLPLWSKGLTIDRIDNDGPYAPENVRWTGYAEQSRNNSNARMLTHRGLTMCAVDWEAHLGMSRGLLNNRLNRHGWSVEKALDTPIDKKRGATTRLEFRGEVRTLAEWSRILGIPDSAIQARLKRGWAVERALSEPINRPRR